MKKYILCVGAGLLFIGTHAQTFNYTGSVQTYTVPALVTSITIDARGAQGGGSYNGAGGLGARMTGTYAVTPGQVLTIIVGQQGLLQVGGNAQNSSGGGGGTFVYDASGPTLLVAAGGGGGKCNYTFSSALHPGAAGQVTTSGAASSDGAAAGGTGGNGGAAGLWSSVPCAGGGTGWLTAGGGPYGGFNASGSWAGGTGYCGGGGGGCGGVGGYGGGGGGGNHYGGGGGGGGYSGGGGGTDPTHGGGGGSYSIGTSQSNTAGYQTGDGQVIIANANPCIGDVTPPTFTVCPASTSTTNNAGICGAVVTYSAPTATDNCPGATGTQTFNYTGSAQTFTVPAAVTSITIDAMGAQGGGSFNGAGGLGARMNATYAVTPGQVLTIVVGQQGLLQVGGNAQNSSGGGGGTFVYDGATLLVAAGGGGGKCNYTSSAPLHPGAAGQITTSGAASSDGAAAGGVGGNGGAAGLWSSVPCAGGGTGWLTPGGGPYGGMNAPTWAGGTGYCGGGGGGCGGVGGYGGGGGGGNHYGGGGGGGGYSGGGGGTDPTHGGGGGSYSIGTSQANTAGYQTGNGQVIIGYNVVSPTVVQTSGLPSGSTFPVGTTVNTFLATDPSGNTATCTFSVTVTDNESPVPSVSVLPTATDECSVTLTAPTATDNCTPSVTGTTVNPTTYSAEGTYTVNWLYTDGAGNTATQTQTVIIDDTTSPVIAGCPNNISLAANNAGCTGLASWTDPTATDNCGGSPTVTASHNTSFPFPVGTTTVTYTFDDGRGNTSTCSFDVTVTNNAAATLAIANDTVCVADGSFTITGESPAGGTFSGPGVSAGSFDPATAGVGTHAITYMYTDANGCAASSVVDSIYVDICLGTQLSGQGSLFSVNPNPNNGTFTLQLNNISSAVVVIYDAQGKLVSSQKVMSSNTQITIAESGMYMITVVTADGQSTSQRVIVQE